jgi:hypothetical protein
MSRNTKTLSGFFFIAPILSHRVGQIPSYPIKKLFTIWAELFTIMALSCGHSIGQEAKEPPTKIEGFIGKSGSVIIKGVGEASAVGNVSVRCLTFLEAGSGKKESGIAIEVSERMGFGAVPERSATAFVDYDETESLIQGIDYISRIDKSATSLPGFEAIYKTRGDLRITTFSTQGGVKVAVQCGHVVTATSYISIGQLTKLREALAAAKSTLDDIKNGIVPVPVPTPERLKPPPSKIGR